MIAETRRYFKGMISTWFTGKDIREASSKFYNWSDYMREKGYYIFPKSLSYGNGVLLVLYRLEDKFK